MSVLEWSVDDVIKYLGEIGLDQYATDFRANEISGNVIPLLEESHLKEMGVFKIGHRLLLKKFILDVRSGQFGKQSSRREASNNVSPSSTQDVRKSTSNISRSIDTPPQAQSPKQSPAQAPKQDVSPKQAPTPKSSNSSKPPMDDGDMGGDEPAPAPKKRPTLPSEKAARAKAAAAADTPPKSPKPAPAKKPSAGGALNKTLRRNAPPPAEADANDDRVSCSYCGRKFASDRIEKHEEICRRQSMKKTKVFDSSKQRLEGEAASFAKVSKNKPKPKKETINGVPKYKLQHQELVKAMRAARKLQAYQDAVERGEAVGPPPEMPKIELVDDDRVQCPHCGRKFGEEQARRHIPNCTGGHGGMAQRRTGRR
ncbi:hypothetical protein TVAG_437140 [Trichomonas vaginalis G3]|uniref:Uncharacterized protein n=1 Tax=Trichomonas vaginalis (strain ATCC PRA-98 / G3) TaxID=412133 RepID=A2DFG0_TRIV3|nr:C2HC-type zinc finger-containing protein [Trichomonas vaginalis G3]EAY20888.1 hypothetical protein TVAG_437140 [Trichomonas vaginalis G3]KAI5521502.1 C2HC-type zinc finger-containing protein [Trichomonas vaginalis G3]|eukprot:XP_001581874.1 hypothetical protein [Trichomonas vaginalis G3]